MSGFSLWQDQLGMGAWWGRTRWNTPGLRAVCLLTPESGKVFPLLLPLDTFKATQLKRQSSGKAKGIGEYTQ